MYTSIGGEYKKQEESVNAYQNNCPNTVGLGKRKRLKTGNMKYHESGPQDEEID
jgi:hypothetical protein